METNNGFDQLYIDLNDINLDGTTDLNEIGVNIGTIDDERRRTTVKDGKPRRTIVNDGERGRTIENDGTTAFYREIVNDIKPTEYDFFYLSAQNNNTDRLKNRH